MAEHDDGEAHAVGFARVDTAAASERARLQRLLRRVADALQVPEASLYDAVARSSPTKTGSDAPGDDLASQCAALERAFRRIRDPEERRRLLALVQAAAERR